MEEHEKMRRLVLPLPESLLRRLDDYRRKQPVPPARTALIRHLMEKALECETKKEAS